MAQSQFNIVTIDTSIDLTGATVTGLTTTAVPAAGSTREVQFNNTGSFSTNSGFQFDATNDLRIPNTLKIGSTSILQSYEDVSGDGIIIGNTNTNNTIGNTNNVVIGPGSGSVSSNTNNVLIGIDCGENLTGLGNNVLIGNSAGNSLTTGSGNVMIGELTGSNTIANITDSVLIGTNAGENLTGTCVVAIGTNALQNSTSSNTIGIGCDVGINNTGNNNIFIGKDTGMDNTTGINNTFIGSNTASRNTIGGSNTFIGFNSASNNISGNRNVFMGLNSGLNNIIGNDNVFIGVSTGRDNNGDGNTYIGRGVATTIDGSNNIIIGNGAGLLLPISSSNKLLINNTTNTYYIYGEIDNYNISLGFRVRTPSFGSSTPGKGCLALPRVDTDVGLNAPSGTAPDSGVIYVSGNDLHFLDSSGSDHVLQAQLETTILAAAPGSPVTGAYYTADGTAWDPAGKAGAVPYPVFYDGVAFIALY